MGYKPYKMQRGSSQCYECGKKITKIFVIEGKHYGSECAAKLIGRAPGQLTAPLWLLEMGEAYTTYRFAHRDNIEDAQDFVTNFFNVSTPGIEISHTEDPGLFGASRIWVKSIKINGKTVKVDWQYELAQYIRGLYTGFLGISPGDTVKLADNEHKYGVVDSYFSEGSGKLLVDFDGEMRVVDKDDLYLQHKA